MPATALQAGKFQVLYSFPTNSAPSAPLVQGNDGALYGVTPYGGALGNGTVFKLTTNGFFTNLVSFNFANGKLPDGGLVFGNDGALYGTTGVGGTGGVGTVFRLTTAGDLSTIGFFTGSNGANPNGLVLGQDGYFYGTTRSGGVFANKNPFGDGTVFRVASNGGLTRLASFAATNGWDPEAGLVEGGDGAFYGTTRYGGAYGTQNGTGYGTVFRVTTNGTLTTLFSFAGTNGAYPLADLAKGADDAFYGVTSSGGEYDRGTVFRVTQSGALTTLVSFASDSAIYPSGGLVEGPDGAFYGTTTQGSFSPARFGGTIFRVTTTGVLSGIYSFADADGRWPEADLLVGQDGAFYGACKYGGGPQNGGTAFRVDPTVFLFTPARQGGGLRITFSGLPASSYDVLSTTNLAGAWTTAGAVSADADGVGTWWDNSPTARQSFYRVVIP